LDVRAAYPLDYRLCLRREDADTPWANDSSFKRFN
jgi:hypothetical protein